MPNHIHLLIVIDQSSASAEQKRSVISKAVGYLKMNVSKENHQGGQAEKIWQRSFHDHIIRGEKDFRKIWEYIEGNPEKWKEDCFYEE